MTKDSILRADIEGPELVIRIGIDTLAFAVGQGNSVEPGVKVTEPVEFAYYVARRIVEFDEDTVGTSALGRLFDAMAVAAQEDSQACVAEPEDEPPADSAPVGRMQPTLRWLQANLPWTIPYSATFEAVATSLDRVNHDVLHVMKSLGRIAAECEGHHHGRDRKLTGAALAKEVADLVICALHIAKLEGFDLEDAVIDCSGARNGVHLRAELGVEPKMELSQDDRDWLEDLTRCVREGADDEWIAGFVRQHVGQPKVGDPT